MSSMYIPFEKITQSIHDPDVRRTLKGILDEHNSARERMNATMSENGWFLTSSEAIQLLIQLTSAHPYSLVLSREDVVPGFWNSARIAELLKHLKSPKQSQIVQTRVNVFDVERSDDRVPDDEQPDVYMELQKVHHNRGGLYRVENTHLKSTSEFKNLRKAKYGLTVFQKDAYPKVAPLFAAVPFPALNLYHLAREWTNPLDMLEGAGKYDPSSDMQMVIILNENLVAEIAAELVQLIIRAGK